MKMKRFLSLLLVVCLMLAAVPSALAVGAPGDYVAYYMTQYEIKAGDTMAKVCSDRGVNYATYRNVILNVNKLSTATSLVAGTKYWLPASGLNGATTYYTVYAHKLVSGDTVYNLCNAYGINMNSYTDLILQVNNAKSLTGFMAGTILYIPVFTENNAVSAGSAAPAAVTPVTTTAATAATTTTTAAATTATAAAPAAAGTTNTNGAQNADYVAFYLTQYEVQVGDTLTAICNTRNIKYDTYKDIILRVNNLAGPNLLIAGLKYWIPAATPGAAAGYYAVYRHVLATGDTVSALCNAYGISLTKSTDLIQKLNGVNNLTSFMATRPIYIPVYHEGAATAVVSGTTVAVTPVTTTVTTTTDTTPVIAGTPGSIAGTPTTVSTTTTTVTTPAATTPGTAAAGTAAATTAGSFDPTAASLYYLVPYTVQSGDTLIGICNALGTSYEKSSGIINAVNGAAAGNLLVGAKLFIPCQNAHGNTAGYYTVQNHTIAAGETVYGLYKDEASFNASYKLLTALNAGVNFNNLFVGQIVVIPVAVGIA